MAEQVFVFNRKGTGAGNIIQPRPSGIKLIKIDPYDQADLTLLAPEDAARYVEQFSMLGRRNSAQREAIAQTAYTLVSRYGDETDAMLDMLFGSALDWAYQCYKVTPTTVVGRDGAVQPVFQDSIYLFNLLIAFEWEPNQRSRDTMIQAMQRASDFLFDVTDGWMAIGQVVIGGPAWLHCADFQVMASNRLHPRSWVGGLHEPAKYMPIRLGRGIWQKNNRISIPWDEPEGYRVLIHEWSHYALELLDTYTELHAVYIPDDVKGTQSAYTARRSNRNLIVPTISQPVESIMATLEGTSELTAHHDLESDQRKQAEWTTLIHGFAGLQGRKPRFPRIPERRLEPMANPVRETPHFDWPPPTDKQFNPLAGPLPIRELPHIRMIESANQAVEQPEYWLTDAAIRADIDREHCWVYLLQYTEGDSIPRRIIAQGTLDAQLRSGFRLLGAHDGDTIALVGTDMDWNDKVLCATLDASAQQTETPTSVTANQPIVFIQHLVWRDCTPNDIPIIDVFPLQVMANAEQTAAVQVRVCKQNSWKESEEPLVFVFPLHALSNAGESPGRYDVSNGPTPNPISLDGHVFVQWRESPMFMIVPFSQGGGPPTGSPVGNSPITAGSAEGNLMIFFADRDEYPLYNQDHGQIKVVVTRLVGPDLQTYDDAEARGYAFSICSNGALPLDYLPTLVLAFDQRTQRADGTLVLYRQDANGYWQPLPSYIPDGAWYVAAGLDRKSAPHLFAPDTGEPPVRCERYRVCLKLVVSEEGS